MWSIFQEHSLDCTTSSVSSEGMDDHTIWVYPNPTEGLLRIHSAIVYDQLDVSVFNTKGQKIFTVNKREDIDIRYLRSGVYFIKVRIDGQVQMQRIVKIE